MTRASRRLRGMLGALSFAVLGGGCSVIVSAEVPTFRCEATGAETCPSGLTCDPSTNTCVTAGPDTSGEASVDGDDDDRDAQVKDAGRDTGKDAPTPLGELGAPCSQDVNCESKLCGTVAMLTGAITSVQICTKTCCTSVDCGDARFVCYGAGTGGNYCVEAAKLKRARTGTKPAGAACSTDAECRSGDCRSPGNRCSDTCCGAGDCGGGTVCSLPDDSGDNPDSFVCTTKPADTDGVGTPCTDSSDCETNVCVGSGASRTCRSSCSGNASCQTAFPNGFCGYSQNVQTGDYVRLCFPKPAGQGSTEEGQPCSEPGQCKSGFCDGTLRICMNVCAEDADCPSDKACRPSAGGTPFLRCVKR